MPPEICTTKVVDSRDHFVTRIPSAHRKWGVPKTRGSCPQFHFWGDWLTEPGVHFPQPRVPSTRDRNHEGKRRLRGPPERFAAALEPEGTNPSKTSGASWRQKAGQRNSRKREETKNMGSQTKPKEAKRKQTKPKETKGNQRKPKKTKEAKQNQRKPKETKGNQRKP